MAFFDRIQTSARKRIAYIRTVSELSALSAAERADVGIGAGDLHRIAHKAVYGA